MGRRLWLFQAAGRERIVFTTKNKMATYDRPHYSQVSDFERSVAFYAKALKPLGITNFIDYEGHDGHPDLKGFGDGKRAFFGSRKESPIPKWCMLDLLRTTMPK